MEIVSLRIHRIAYFQTHCPLAGDGETSRKKLRLSQGGGGAEKKLPRRPNDLPAFL